MEVVQSLSVQPIKTQAIPQQETKQSSNIVNLGAQSKLVYQNMNHMWKGNPAVCTHRNPMNPNAAPLQWNAALEIR